MHYTWIVLKHGCTLYMGTHSISDKKIVGTDLNLRSKAVLQKNSSHIYLHIYTHIPIVCVNLFDVHVSGKLQILSLAAES